MRQVGITILIFDKIDQAKTNQKTNQKIWHGKLYTQRKIQINPGLIEVGRKLNAGSSVPRLKYETK